MLRSESPDAPAVEVTAPELVRCPCVDDGDATSDDGLAGVP